LAVLHQTGLSLPEVKLQIDDILKSIKSVIGDDKKQHDQAWAGIIEVLDILNVKKAHPKWMTIIKYARYRIRSRIQTAVYSPRRFSR